MIADHIRHAGSPTLERLVDAVAEFIADFVHALEISRRIDELAASKGRLDGDDVRRIADELTRGRRGR